MKVLVVVFIFITCSGMSQSFKKAEYFFDTDPGPGNGTPLALAPSGDIISFTTTISTSSLSPGFHFLALRMQQADRVWGIFESRGFYISEATGAAKNISKAEYFFDNDPGSGNGIPIPIVSGSTTNFTVALPASSLVSGFHFLAIRVRDSDGIWSVFESRGFYISEATTSAVNISKVEYFFDNDPGAGNATAIPVVAGSVVNFTVPLSASALTSGFHFVAIRAKGADGKWGIFESRGFYISSSTNAAADITAAEYFFDTDPGTGNGLSIAVPSGASSSFTISLPATGLPSGFHTLAIRSKGADGKWGIFESRSFYISSEIGTAADIVAAEFFFDTDPGIGNGGTLIVSPPSATINQNFTVPVPSSLPSGIHTVSIRVQSSDRKWSMHETGSFEVSLNQLPVAVAGNDQSITLPANQVTVDGSSSHDTDGSIANYVWTKITGPSSGIIVAPNQSVTSITNLTAGIYTFELLVTDNGGFIDRDTVQVVVNPKPNQPPKSKASADVVVVLPNGAAVLSGLSSSDIDGIIASYRWSKISGPSAGIVLNESLPIATAVNLVQGVYRFELEITDNGGLSDRDTVELVVSAASNQPPHANAGPDQFIVLPANTTLLTGAGSFDVDGTITSHAWSKISGPPAGILLNENQSVATAANLVEGIYKFELMITDNGGLSDRDTIRLVVSAAGNQAPNANAGPDQFLVLPTNTIVLTGSSSFDLDGSITSYTWSKINGPSVGTLLSADKSIATAINLTQGVYTFELLVVDDDGLTNRDTVLITVNDGPNQPPLANAGADIVIDFPANTVVLAGAATDADGTINTLSWRKIRGPSGGIILHADHLTTEVSALQAGVYAFELQVLDNKGSSASDTVQLFVNPGGCSLLPVITQLDDRLVCNPKGTAYQWYRDGLAIANETKQVLEISLIEFGSYAVELTSNSCTTRSTNFVYLITDTDFVQQPVTIYPNPVRDILWINIPLNTSHTSTTIIDALGRNVYEATLTVGPNEIDVHDFASGIYYLSIDGKLQYKLLKM
jgi:hypothetical protein